MIGEAVYVGVDVAKNSLDALVAPGLAGMESVGKMSANVGKEDNFEREPHRNRTCNLLIKSQLLCQLS